MAPQHEESIRDEFTRQSDSFAGSPAMSAADTLGVLIELAPVDASARWLETACGPGLIARALAPRMGSVRGVDLTPAMLELAERGAVAESLDNVSFSLGDATALEFADDSFNGAITRYSLHHIPAPVRVVAEMARVVRPGGWVIVGDHLTDEDSDAAAWHEEIERLRDPSHWACMTLERLRGFGEQAGLVLDEERLVSLDLDLDFDEWLGRGSGAAASAPLIERLLAEAPVGAQSFRVVDEGDGRRLKLRYLLSRWRVPGQS